MSGYTRQSVADIVPTAVVRAAPINAEYDKLRDAFAFSSTGTTGHKHDGTSDEGSYVPLIADLDGQNKIQVDQTNNRFGVFIEVGATSTEQLRFQDGVIVPVTDNDIDLGSATYEYKNVYVDGTAYIDTVSIGDNDYTVITNNAYTVTGDLTFDVSTNINLDADGGNVALKDSGTTYATFTSNAGNLVLKSGTTTAATFTGANVDLAGTLDVTGAAVLDSTLNVAGNASFNSNMTLGNDVLDTITYSGRVASSINPSTDSTYNLGTTSLYWANAYIDAITTTGNVAVGGNATVTGTLSVTSNTALTGNLNINGNTVIGDASTDTVTVTAGVSSNVIPTTDSAYTLGSATKYWSHGYIDAITTTGNAIVGGSLSVGTTLDMTNGLINNVATPVASTDAANKGYVDTQVSNLVDAAPGALDTLNELAAALGDDPNFSTTVTNSIATKLPLAGGTMTGNITMGGNTVTGLATPSVSSDAATKGYIDSIFGSTTSAAASAAAAEAAYDSFDDRYLGPKASAPSVDNDGNALLTGALYFNTTDNTMKVWSGSAWLDAYASLSGALIATNNLSDLSDAATSRQNLGVEIGVDVQAYDATIVVDADIGVTVQAYDANNTASANLNSFIAAVTLPTADGTAGQFLKTDGAGTVSFASIPTINTLNDIGNVTITSAASGEFLQWNGSAWVNATVEAFDTQTHTTTATTQVSIAEYAHATYDGVKAVITADDGTNRSITEILITHNGTTAVATEYAQVNTNTALATFDVDISGTDIRILATPAAATSTGFTVKAITL